MTTKHKIIELIGWYGVLAILIAYFLISFRFVESSSLIYQLLNFSGAIAIMIDAIVDKNYQPVFLNIIWAIVALVVILTIVF